MDPKTFGDWLSGEIDVVSHVSFWVAIGVAAVVIWRVMEWRYSGIIERLRDERDNLLRKPKSAMTIKVSEPPEEVGSGKSLLTLRRARDNAQIAISQGTETTQAKAYHELDATMLTVEKHFGIAPLKVPAVKADLLPYKIVLSAYVQFVDRFYPLLREGHIEEARRKAESFTCCWGP